MGGERGRRRRTAHATHPHDQISEICKIILCEWHV